MMPPPANSPERGTLTLAKGRVRVHFVRRMKSLLRLILLIGTAGAITGCASREPKEVFHAGDEVPPDFVAGPAALLLTNLDGFSATAAFSLPVTAGQTKPVSGDLLERQGRLIFQPATRPVSKKNPLMGGMIFIWDEAAHSGYVLNDPLQAFARIVTGVQGTNLIWQTDGASQEEANGHPCRRLEATVQCSDGSTAQFIVWQAEDARHLPVRIRAVTGSRQFTLDLTNVRLDLPPPELFTPPDGFTRYDTSVALMDELILRQTELLKSTERRGNADESMVPTVPTWRQGQTQ